MEKLPTNTPLDKMLDGGLEKNTVTNVYGPAGSGKTNVALMAARGCIKDGKVIYVDTEGSFSVERFFQVGGTERDLKNIIFIEVHTWEEQHKKIKALQTTVEKVRDVRLIVVDSIVALYRLVLDDENFQTINRQLATQYSVLSRIAREHDIPVLVTNQVYSDAGGVELTSRNIGKYWSKALIELRRGDRDNQRTAILRKHRSLPEGKKIDFEITQNGMKEVRFGLF